MGERSGGSRRQVLIHRISTIACLALIAVLGACGGSGSPAAARSPAVMLDTSVAADGAAAATPNQPCADGRIRVGDLPAIDATWRSGLSDAAARAKAWQADARLVAFQVGCQILSPSFRWRATFYSGTAQLYFASDTGQTTPAETNPAQIPTLPTDNISFGLLRRALAKSGFSDAAELSPVSGIDIRLSTDNDPFGPPGAPRGDVYFHVAVEANGEIKDLFVSATDGVVYRYQTP